MSLKQLVFRAFPRSYQIPVRYAYRYLHGNIDRELRLLRALTDLMNHEHEYINNFVFVHRHDARRARLNSA